ncbi:hypothetical protein B0H19DRAFT_1064397 [Mycena capillaripes]|nr:hypothetical protein B0H19DRAFT_1064397 [Mycena capillaripes]
MSYPNVCAVSFSKLINYTGDRADSQQLRALEIKWIRVLNMVEHRKSAKSLLRILRACAVACGLGVACAKWLWRAKLAWVLTAWSRWGLEHNGLCPRKSSSSPRVSAANLCVVLIITLRLISGRYKFHWLECNDGTVREFLKKTALPGAQLTDKQIGNIRLPFYMSIDHRGHKSFALTSIFAAALPLVAVILKSWDTAHSAVRNFNSYSVDGVFSDPLATLMQHNEFGALSDDELNQRVLDVASALFQLLAVQSELGEPLNLNGDLISDLADKSVVPYGSDGQLFLAMAP